MLVVQGGGEGKRASGRGEGRGRVTGKGSQCVTQNDVTLPSPSPSHTPPLYPFPHPPSHSLTLHPRVPPHSLASLIYTLTLCDICQYTLNLPGDHTLSEIYIIIEQTTFGKNFCAATGYYF